MSKIKKGDRVVITRKVEGEVTYLSAKGDYIEVKIDTYGYAEGFYMNTFGQNVEVVKPNGLEQFKALPVGAYFRTSFDSDLRIKVSDTQFYNTAALDTFDVTKPNDTKMGLAPHDYTIEEVSK